MHMTGIILEKLVLSAVIIPLIAVFRFAGGRGFGAVWKKLLWIIMAVWLLIPFSFSFGGRAGFHKEVALLTRTQAIEAGYGFLEYIPELIESYKGFQAVPVIYFVMIFSLLAAFIKILYHNRQYGFSVNRLLDTMSEESDERILGLWKRVLRDFNIKRDIPVYRSRLNNPPMIIGSMSPALILPEKAHDWQEQLIYDIMRHEAMHYKLGDLWYKKFLLLVSDVYWFNPFVYLMRKLAYEDVELACDELVTKGLSNEDRAGYCHAILSMAEICGGTNKYAVEFSVDAKRLKKRVDNVFAKKDVIKGVLLTIFFCVIFFVAAGLTDIRTGRNGGYLSSQTDYDIARHFSSINWVYFSDNSKLGRVELSYVYDGDGKPEEDSKLGEHLHIVVACEKYDKLSDTVLEGIRTVFRAHFEYNLIDVEIKKLEP